MILVHEFIAPEIEPLADAKFSLLFTHFQNELIMFYEEFQTVESSLLYFMGKMTQDFDFKFFYLSFLFLFKLELGLESEILFLFVIDFSLFKEFLGERFRS